MADFIPMDQVDQSSPAMSGNFIPLDQAQEQSGKKGFKFGRDSTDADHLANLGRAAVGITEVMAGGLADLAATGASGAAALVKATTAKAAGLNFADTFTNEFSKTYQGINRAIPYQPETSTGKVIQEKVNKILSDGIQWIGDNSVRLSQFGGAGPKTSAAI